MGKVIITRKELEQIGLEEIQEDSSSLDKGEIQKRLRFSTEYIVNPEERDHTTTFYVARTTTGSKDINNPLIYLIFKTHLLREETEKGIKTERINPYPISYETSIQEAEQTAYGLAIESAKRFKGLEIEDQTGLKDSKLETSLKDIEGPSAMWDVQPGA